MTKVGSGLSKKADSVQAAREAAEIAVKAMGNGVPALVLVFCSTIHNYEQVLAEIKSVTGASLIAGCSTAGEFTEKTAATGSIAVLAISSETVRFEIFRAENVKGDYHRIAEEFSADYEQEAEAMACEGFSNQTVIMLMDGLVGNGEDFVKTVYNKSGILPQIVGGAAADDGKFVKTHVFHGTEALSNAIVFIKLFSKNKVGIGVAHGMKSSTRPMRVTRSVGSVLYELDGKPAFEVYKEYALSRGIELTPENTFRYLINNELAIQDLTFTKIRAPLTANEDGSLNMTTEVPQGCMVTIVDSSEKELLEAARNAGKEAKKNLGGKISGIIVFDCICRQTILGNNFIKGINEIEKVFGENIPLAGFSTYGEIARFSGTLNGFHNATTVVCAIPE